MMTVMMQRICVFTLGLTMIATLTASAQGTEAPRIFIGVNVGGQAHSHTFGTSAEIPIYSETATMRADQGVGGGFLFDISGGVKVSSSIGVSIGLTTMGDTSDGTMSATVPHPLYFDQFVTVTKNVSNLDHSELGIHLSAVFFLPVPDALPDKSEIRFLIGPSFFNVDQDLVQTITVPAGTQDADPVVARESATGAGINVGFDFTYPVADRIGAGLFLRYAGGSVDLDSAEGVKAGGFQVGVGVRVAF